MTDSMDRVWGRVANRMWDIVGTCAKDRVWAPVWLRTGDRVLAPVWESLYD